MEIKTETINGKLYVEGSLYLRTLKSMADLINQQRSALRTHDKALQRKCMEREDKMLAYYDTLVELTEKFRKGGII